LPALKIYENQKLTQVC